MAFRIILAIPHFFVLYFLAIGASVIAVIGWCGALFTGHLPVFATTYLSGYTRWYCRVGAYLLLLTDEYPPFSFEDAAYPVRMAVSQNRPLNRLTVLFRIILAIPATILSTILANGVATVVVFIAWLAALVAGRLPRSLHHAFAAVLRYITRYNSYLYLLTDAYPGGLFGDRPGTQAAPADPAGDRGYRGYRGPGAGDGGPGPGYVSPPPGAGYGGPGPGYVSPPPGAGYGYGTPDQGYWPAAGYDAPGYGAPAPGYGTPAARYGSPGHGAPMPGYATPGYATPGYATPGYGTREYGTPEYRTPSAPGHRARAAGPSGQPPNWTMVLPAGAKLLVGLILALGLLTTIGGGVSAGAALQRVSKINQLNAAIARHNNAVVQNQKAIGEAKNAIHRVTSAHAKFASEADAFVTKVQACRTLSCFDAAAGKVAGSLAGFGRRLHAVTVPAGAAAAANKLARDTARDRRIWLGLRHAVSFTDFENQAKRSQKAGEQFDHDYSALTRSLNKRGDALSRQAKALNERASSLNRQAAALNAGWERIFGTPSPATAQ